MSKPVIVACSSVVVTLLGDKGVGLCCLAFVGGGLKSRGHFAIARDTPVASQLVSALTDEWGPKSVSCVDGRVGAQISLLH